MGLIKKGQQKVKDYLNNYVKNIMFPCCYVVYRRLLNEHRVVDEEEYMSLVYEEMKTPQGERE